MRARLENRGQKTCVFNARLRLYTELKSSPAQPVCAASTQLSALSPPPAERCQAIDHLIVTSRTLPASTLAVVENIFIDVLKTRAGRVSPTLNAFQMATFAGARHAVRRYIADLHYHAVALLQR